MDVIGIQALLVHCNNRKEQEHHPVDEPRGLLPSVVLERLVLHHIDADNLLGVSDTADLTVGHRMITPTAICMAPTSTIS